VAIYSQPPKPAGRGQQLQKSPVHQLAEKKAIEVFTPSTFRDAVAQKQFADLKPDIAVVAAYGLILPLPVLQAPKYGCINVHASLLPRWRGAAPIQRAILAGDAETGVTIMQMAEGLDTGAMLLKDRLPITNTTTAQGLHDELAAMGARLTLQALDDVFAGKMKPVPQVEDEATYAQKLTRGDGRIDWRQSAVVIERRGRALQPWPGCFFMLGDEAIKVLSAEIIEDKSGMPGTLLDNKFTVACGEGALRLTKIQRSGKDATDGASFLRGMRMDVGHKL
jgi:methionyl-tRNA formyltransferase